MSKYHAVMTNGYASKREAKRAEELKILEKTGHITELREQVEYVLAPSVIINGRKRPPLRYFADFEYMYDGKLIVEDVKGVITESYRIKRHLMKSVLGIDITET